MAILLCAHASWLAWSATWQSPTLNEPGHLAAGIAHWQLGRFEPYAVNPPLVRMIAAIPVLAAGCETDWADWRGRPGERPEFALGAAFVRANGSRTQRLMELARWACLPFSLLGAWMCFVWGRALFGPRSGLLACALWCVGPNLIAHGQLITPDVAAAATGLVALWTLWKWLDHGGWGRAAAAGAACGLAILTKFSWLILGIAVPILWLITRRLNRGGSGSGSRWGREAMQLALAAVIAVDVINLAYGFDGSFRPLGSFEFSSQRLAGPVKPGQLGNRFEGTGLGKVPVPFPAQFVLGLDLQTKDFEVFPHRSYLRGEWRQGGWWHYYVYAALVKTPLGLWLLAGSALFLAMNRHSEANGGVALGIDRAIGVWTLLIPASLLFLAASAETAFNHHFRYVLPCAGPLFVLISSVAARRGPRVQAWVLVNLVWITISSVAAAPHSLSYFNEWAGGMRNGARHLLHSNLDWGQDLVSLKAWIDRHPDRKPVFLAYYGFFDPSAFGVEAEQAPQGPFWGARPRDWSFRPGWYAISVNFLYGAEWRLANPEAYRPFRDREPDDWCGASIPLFHVDAAFAAELTERATQSAATITP